MPTISGYVSDEYREWAEERHIKHGGSYLTYGDLLEACIDAARKHGVPDEMPPPGGDGAQGSEGSGPDDPGDDFMGTGDPPSRPGVEGDPDGEEDQEEGGDNGSGSDDSILERSWF